jgi:hypothetical protein
MSWCFYYFFLVHGIYFSWFSLTPFWVLSTCHLFFYSYVHTLFMPFLPPSSHALLYPPTPITSRQNIFCLLLQFCWRENIRDNQKNIAFLLVWDKDSYTERFLALLPCTSSVIFF